jgi:hypothetical protein
MKTITKIILGVTAVAAVIAYLSDQGRKDERQLELVIQETGRVATCTRTDDVQGHDWAACRWSDSDQGPVWIRVGEQDGRPVWTTANGRAISTLEAYRLAAPADRQAKLAQVRPREPGEDLPGSVPWDELN